jgi:hypothetical protein
VKTPGADLSEKSAMAQYLVFPQDLVDDLLRVAPNSAPCARPAPRMQPGQVFAAGKEAVGGLAERRPTVIGRRR